MSVNQQVKLCILSLGFFPTRGGAELRFRRYLPHLRHRGIVSEIISGTPETRKLDESDKNEPWYRYPVGYRLPTILLEDSPVHRVRLPDSDPSKRMQILAAELLRFCQQPGCRPNVVQILSKLRPSIGHYFSELRKMNIPIVYVHTTAGRLPNHFLRKIIRRIAFRSLCKKLDCIITSSRATQKIFLELGIRTRMEAIPNGVDLKRFRPAEDNIDRQRLRQSLGIGGQTLAVLFIGSINFWKGVDILLESWILVAKRFPHAHLYLIGNMHDSDSSMSIDFTNRLKSFISGANALDRVHFLGYVENVEEYLRASDIFVFPSRREGMGNVVLEAMASGLPCVLTPFIGFPKDFGKPGNEYLLVEHDPLALSATMAKLIEYPALRSQMGAAGRKWMEQTMDLEMVLDRYADVYRSLAASARSTKQDEIKHP